MYIYGNVMEKDADNWSLGKRRSVSFITKWVLATHNIFSILRWIELVRDHVHL
jgi:hypothetical protein